EDGIDEARLLGAVAAHEVGHLLLGLRAHTLWGIMAPRWSGEALRQVGMGRLLFTPEQAARMRGKVRGYSAADTYIEAVGSSLGKREDFPADRSYISGSCLQLAPSYAYPGCERLAMQR